MAIYFLDASALIKRYVAETGTGWVRALCDPAAGHSIVIAQAAQVETVATVCRKAREGNISTRDRDRTIAEFRRDVQRAYSVECVTQRCISARATFALQ